MRAFALGIITAVTLWLAASTFSFIPVECAADASHRRRT